MAEQILGCHLPPPVFEEADRVKYAWNCVCWTGGEGLEVLPFKVAQQEGAANGVPAVIGVGAVGRQTHVFPCAIADKHHPLGQVTPSLNGAPPTIC